MSHQDNIQTTSVARNNHPKKIFSPNHTQIPNVILDYWMSVLNGSEFKILLCICRNTFGWQREKTDLSRKDIIAKTGLGEQAVRNGIKILEDHQLIIKKQNIHSRGDFDANTYEILITFYDQNPYESPPGAVKITQPLGCFSPNPPTPAPYIVLKKDIEIKESNTIVPNSCSGQPEPPKKIAFSKITQKFENITEQDLSDLAIAYPTVNLTQELTKMILWCKANPSRATSNKNWRKFINTWLSKQNDSNIRGEANAHNKSNGNKIDRRPRDKDGNILLDPHKDLF